MKRTVLILAFLVGCGGHSAPPPAGITSEVLSWEQPWTFSDNTAMTPRDVARWDIYCSPVPSFIDNDLVACVVTPDNLAFNLTDLRPFGIAPGPDGAFISIRCVGIDNQQSAFAEPTMWTK